MPEPAFFDREEETRGRSLPPVACSVLALRALHLLKQVSGTAPILFHDWVYCHVTNRKSGLLCCFFARQTNDSISVNTGPSGCSWAGEEGRGQQTQQEEVLWDIG